VFRRVLVLVFLAAISLPLGAGMAAAHGDGMGPEMHVPRVLAVDPPLPGLQVAVIEAGARLRLDNRTDRSVQVLPEPGSHVHEPPIAPGRTARWADPRVRAAAADPAPAEGRRAWSVPLQVGDRVVTVRGEQVWPAAPSSLSWWLMTLLAAVGTALLGVRAVGRPRWAPALAAATVLVAVAHAVHVVGSALVVEDSSLPGIVIGTAGPALLAWVLAALGAVLTLTGRGWGPLLCALSGALLALVTAFAANNFGAPVLPFAGPPELDRAAVALTLGGGVGLFLSGFAAVGRLSPEPAR
jgi:hypothetical protein